MRRDKSQSLPRTAYRHPAVTGGAFVSAAFLAALLASPTAASAVPLKPAGNTANLVLVCRFNGDSSDTYNSTSMTPSKTWWQSLMNAVNNGAAGNGSNGSTSPDDNLLGNTNGGKDGKTNDTENGKRKLPMMLQQTGVTVSIFVVIGAAIGAVAAIVAAIRKRK